MILIWRSWGVFSSAEFQIIGLKGVWELLSLVFVMSENLGQRI